MLARFTFLTMIGLTLVSSIAAEEPSTVASQHWKLGQEALHRGQNQEAIDHFEESLAYDSGMTRNYLSLAAANLGLGEESRACLYLTLYVAAHPEHVAIRGHYADLLQRLHRMQDARLQYETFLADVQSNDDLAEQHLVRCHSQLMQIAESLRRPYDEHLHRGIGLLLLAKERKKLAETEGELSVESLLCRAAGELTLARRSRPEQARTYWYLHEVWSELLQSHSARRSLRQAEELAPFSYLTPTERHQLYLTSRRQLSPK